MWGEASGEEGEEGTIQLLERCSRCGADVDMPNGHGRLRVICLLPGRNDRIKLAVIVPQNLQRDGMMTHPQALIFKGDLLPATIRRIEERDAFQGKQDQETAIW